MATPFRRGYVKRYIRFNAVRRGLLGGSRLWTTVFFAGHVGRWVNKVAKRGEMPVITSDKIEPGEGLIIRHIPEPVFKKLSI